MKASYHELFQTAGISMRGVQREKNGSNMQERDASNEIRMESLQILEHRTCRTNRAG